MADMVKIATSFEIKDFDLKVSWARALGYLYDDETFLSVGRQFCVNS